VANDFPKLVVNTQELTTEIENLLASAERSKENMGAVNWGDIGVKDIQYRLSMLTPQDGPHCVVIVEEADPGCHLQMWLNNHLQNSSRFPNTYVECEW
jgi:hypothetical protein